MEGPPALDLDALMEQLRAELARRQRASEAEFVAAAHLAVLARQPTAAEARRMHRSLLLGELHRGQLLRQLVDSQEGRDRGGSVPGLRRALIGERLRRSLAGRWLIQVLRALAVVALLPRRIVQFVERVDTLERRVSDAAIRLEWLEQEFQGLKSAGGHADDSSETR